MRIEWMAESGVARLQAAVSHRGLFLRMSLLPVSGRRGAVPVFFCRLTEEEGRWLFQLLTDVLVKGKRSGKVVLRHEGGDQLPRQAVGIEVALFTSPRREVGKDFVWRSLSPSAPSLPLEAEKLAGLRSLLADYFEISET